MEKLGAWQQKVVSDAMQGGHDFWSLLAGSKLIQLGRLIAVLKPLKPRPLGGETRAVRASLRNSSSVLL